ncbi:alpha/beta hydrolase [Odoribacter splanchnicus]|uniref:Alpha/beta hydrolase n=2 Tax=Odoribacter splanchnicus TaxID=28118 RepID=A0A413IAH1_9BACT|nr:alpha/beta hydrolase [Odoribacter splanchnicus]
MALWSDEYPPLLSGGAYYRHMVGILISYIMKIVSLLFLLFVSLTLGAQDITGKWYGYPDLKNMRLRLEYHVEKAGGGYQVTLKIPDLSEKTYRADAVELADHVLTVNIADAQTRSILRLQADGSLKGTFLWEGYDFELLLTRTPVVFKRPQTPKEPFSYHSEEVTFQNADDGVTLAGTLTWPASGARCKAVVLVSGSGGQDRNNTFSEHKTFFVLADYLARHGIATLRVDDRGVGKSGGNLKESGLPDADADAVAAVNYLKQRPEINADSVGVIGHSEGAFVAFSMAARKEVPFIITLAGGGVSGSELLLMQRAALLRASGVKEDFIEKYNNYMRQAQDIVLQSGDAATCERKLTELFNGTPLAGQASATTQQLYNVAKIELLKYNPEWDFPEITCPVLALNGDKDCQVPVENLEFIRKGISENGNTQVKTIVFPGLNHMFQPAVTGSPVEYSDIEETIAPAVLQEIVNWLNQLK